MMRTPAGHGRLELSLFLTPPVVADHRNAPVNALGYLRVMFAVDDIDETLERLRQRGAQLVGEVVQYKDAYRLCYIRGPEGLLIGPAQEANEMRDWRIYADVAQGLIRTARQLYVNEPLAVDLANTVYALDATIIDLCLSVFPWARYRRRDAAVKLHTQVDLRGLIPTVVHITERKRTDVTFLDDLVIEPGAIYIMDRGYVDFERLHRFTDEAAFFVTRTKKGIRFRRRVSRPVDFATGLQSDHTVGLATAEARRAYPGPLRRVRYVDPTTTKRLTFLTNNFTVPALAIPQLYKSRWQVELFFRWIKQHLRIKAFYGTAENAVKTQIWIALSIYVLVAIVKKRLSLEISLYKLLQILSITLFEKMPISTAVFDVGSQFDDIDNGNQLELFDL